MLACHYPGIRCNLHIFAFSLPLVSSFNKQSMNPSEISSTLVDSDEVLFSASNFHSSLVVYVCISDSYDASIHSSKRGAPDQNKCCTLRHFTPQEIHERQVILQHLRTFFRNVHELDFTNSPDDSNATLRSKGPSCHPRLVVCYKAFPPNESFSLLECDAVLLLLEGNSSICINSSTRFGRLFYAFLPLNAFEIQSFWQYIDWKKFLSCTGNSYDANKPRSTTPPILERMEDFLSRFPKECLELDVDENFILSQCNQLSLQSAFIENNWNFAALLMSSDEIFAQSLCIFKQSGCLDKLNIKLDVFVRFMFVIRQNYQMNSYHNFSHAVDTLQAAYTIYKMSKHELSALDLFALLIGAIAHDIGHPGLTNQYLANSASSLSTFYNDKSTLENLHSSILFNIISQPQFNFMSHVTSVEFNSFRKIVINCIYFTDMDLHASFISKLEARTLNIKEKPLCLSDYDDKMLFINCLIKSADISNVTRPHYISCHWADAIHSEFQSQVDKERACGYPSSVVADILKNGKIDSQISFITHAVIPFWKWFDVLVGNSLSLILSFLNSNLEIWRSYGDKAKNESVPSGDCHVEIVSYPPVKRCVTFPLLSPIFSFSRVFLNSSIRRTQSSPVLLQNRKGRRGSLPNKLAETTAAFSEMNFTNKNVF